jgi:hypothetical protein
VTAVLFCAAVLLPGCRDDPGRDPALAEAFVAPATLQLRAELVARAPLVATLHHGDRVEIIGRRRRFYKIRTKAGAEGWTDSRQLLSTLGMERLQQLADRAARAPSQGEASVFETLNVHTAPNRQAPTFFQIAANQKVAIVAQDRVPRLPYQPPAPLLPALPPPRRVSAAPRQQARVPPPPPPPAPAVPKDWLALSGHPEGAPSPPPAQKAAEANAGAPLEMWTLVRAPDGRAGWVLTRLLLMAIPDEILQYAERARITSAFVIGQTRDRTGAHPTWLWTALATCPDCDFDSIRVFAWNTRRHRYETTYIERNLTGWLPVTLSAAHAGGPVTGFTFVARDKTGSLFARHYTLTGFRVRLTGRTRGEMPPHWAEPPGTGGDEEEGEDAETPSRPGWRERVSDWISSLKRRLGR